MAFIILRGFYKNPFLYSLVATSKEVFRALGLGSMTFGVRVQTHHVSPSVLEKV